MGQSSSAKKAQREVDALEDLTQFSASEIKEWRSRFLDDYPSGVISRDEFVAMYKELFPNGDATRFAHCVFKAYDMDGNGVISFKEFISTISLASRGSPDQKLNWAFDLYDANDDGSISRKEAVDIIWSIYRARGEGSKIFAEESAFKIFMALDKNKDDRLSRHEFIRGIKGSSSIMNMLCPPGMDVDD